MTSRLRKLGLTPAKGALVALLAFGLLAVWAPMLKQLWGSSSVSSPTPRQTAANTPAVQQEQATSATPQQKSTQATSKRRVMPGIGLTEAVALDPFEIPGWSPLAQAVVTVDGLAQEDSAKAKFETLRQSGVAMVLVSGGEQVVQIGEQTLRVGDIIEGFQIIEINDSGVVFRPVNSREKARGA